MYNYQQHQRQQKLTNQCKKVYEQFLEDNQIRKNINNTFYNNHKKRIDAFTLSVVQSPIEIDQYVPPVYNPRSVLKSVHPVKSFKMNSHTTLERLQPIIQRNSFLDCIPASNSTLHQFKDYSADKGKRPFKFTASCTAVRLMDHMMNSRMNQVQNCRVSSRTLVKIRQTAQNFHPQDRKPRKQLQQTLTSTSNCHKIRFKPDIIPNKCMKQVQKVLMPNLHRKAYFNSMKTLLVQQPTINTAEFAQNQKQANDRYDIENQKDIKKNKLKNKTNQHINRKENAINAMIRCKLMKSRTMDGNTTKDSLRA